MKKINHFRTLVLLLLLLMCSAKYSLAQLPCTASLIAMPGINGNVTFNAYASQANTLSINPFSWNFGNGSVVTGTNLTTASMQYTANGIYTITTTYTSATAGCTAVATTTVNVTNANGCNLVPGIVWTTNAGGVVNLMSNSQYTVPGTTYTWIFGDASANGSGASVSHTYTPSGTTYSVTLIVNNNTTPACSATVGTNVFVCGLGAIVSSAPNSNGSVTFSAAAVNTGSVNYSYWSFGDNTGYVTGSGFPSLVQTHTYVANGTYTVNVMIAAGSCSANAVYTVNVGNVTAPCNIMAQGYYGQSANGVVNFSNGTTGTGGAVTYLWGFGDGGSSTATSPVHTYSANGTYIATLTANNNYSYACISTNTVSILVNSICNIVAGISYTSGVNGLVSFSNTSTGVFGSMVVVSWDFGDNNSGGGPNPSHIYANGVYTVTLFISNFSSTIAICTASVSQVVTVTNACVANAGFTMTPTSTPQVWTATPLAPGNITAASWDWGDNSNSGTLYTSHSYSAAGTYSICLSVTVSCGTTASYCMPYAIYKPSGTGQSMEVIQVTVIDPATVGIKNHSAETLAAFIAPNPSNGSFNVTANGLNAATVSISIYNEVGRLVYQSDAESSNGSLTKEVQLDNAANGVYFVKLKSEGKIFTQKLVINKQ